MIVKVSDNFRDRYEFARTHISRDTVISQFALVFIILVAILLRFMPAFEFNWVLGANDPYSDLIAARAIDSQINNLGLLGSLLNYLTYVDPIMWYPHVGVRVFGQTQNIGTPMSAVIVRRLFLLFGVNFTISDAAFIAPAFCGVLTVIVIYFLGKEIANKRIGLLSAFFLATSSGDLQRSMAGFFGNEPVGILCMLLTFYFFLRSLRKGSFVIAILAGFSLAGLLLAWGGATYTTQLLALYAIVMLLTKKFSLRLLTAYGGTIITGLSIAILYPREGPALFLSSDGAIPIAVLIILLIVSVYSIHKEIINKLPFLSSKNLELIGYTIIFGGIGFLILNFFIPIIPSFRAKFITVILPFYRDGSPIIASVAEQIVTAWGTMFRDLFLLEFLLPIAIIYLYKKPTENNIFLLLYIFTGLYFYSSMIRVILIMAPAASLGAAKAVEEILEPFAMVRQEKFFLSKRKRSVSVSIGQEHVSIAFFVIFIVLGINFLQGLTVSSQIIQPASITIGYKAPNGTITTYDDWYQAIDWLQRNTPQNSVIASWWDYGYWLTLANRTLVVDGATLNSTQVGNIGALFMETPDVALKIASYYDINYIVVLVSQGLSNLDNDLGKVQWMVKIAEASGNIDKALGAPIQSKNFFSYDSQGELSGYSNATFKSLIWALMTDTTYSNSQTIKNYQSQNLVSGSPDLTTGYQSGYEIYRQIFQEGYLSSNGIVNIIKINWNAAQQLVGVRP